MKEETSSYLPGIRVLEVANELGEYCGKLLAGLGADVVKIEGASGESTRGIGPFLDDEPDREKSLYFWHYNFGKRSVVLDLDTAADQERFRALAAAADVVIDSRSPTYMRDRGIGYEALRAINPGIIYLRISPFGDDGPWAAYRGSDLVHLALGGVMMNCGYDPDPSGFYETPPVAPQMWQSYHLVGEMAVMSVLGALSYRLKSGEGQHFSAAVHEAVAKNTEQDLPAWIYQKHIYKRLTCRHARHDWSPPNHAATKDGRYLLPLMSTAMQNTGVIWDGTVNLLKKYGMWGEKEEARFADVTTRGTPENKEYIAVLLKKLVGKTLYSTGVWRDALENGLTWAPLRRPEENVGDPHWEARDTFFEVEHPELGRSFTYVGAKWVCREVPWRRGPRPPRLGEHTDEVLREWVTPRPLPAAKVATKRWKEAPLISHHGKPFALSDVRVVDLSWMLASAGAGRFLTAMGAEVIKVEHASRIDGVRLLPGGVAPIGGREARSKAVSPNELQIPVGTDRSGFFMEINSGKLGMSLNLKHPEGRKILEEMIRDADMIVEGFSPGTMDRMGLGYERLKELNPSIIYVQQSAFGQAGTYGAARGFGPTAQAISGLSEMSGLPEPYPPAGIGYSYLDWFGAYNMANAMLAALYRRNVTGKGCYIDASQAETGIYLTGTAVLDYSANGRRWSRYGNRSPYMPAAPHGAYRTRGEDRWIAIAAFDEADWQALVRVLGAPAWARDPRFARLEDRLAHQDALDALLEQETKDRDGFELMQALQAAGVAAGVCQTAEDRFESDPQLKHLGWMVELPQSEIGTWPVKEHPVRMSVTPTYIGGRHNRSGPSLGEDTDYVLKTYLGYDETRIRHLRDIGAI